MWRGKGYQTAKGHARLVGVVPDSSTGPELILQSCCNSVYLELIRSNQLICCTAVPVSDYALVITPLCLLHKQRYVIKCSKGIIESVNN